MSGNVKLVELHVVRVPKGIVLDTFRWLPAGGGDVTSAASLSACHVWKFQVGTSVERRKVSFWAHSRGLPGGRGGGVLLFDVF